MKSEMYFSTTPGSPPHNGTEGNSGFTEQIFDRRELLLNTPECRDKLYNCKFTRVMKWLNCRRGRAHD